MIDSRRIQQLNDKAIREGKCVLYWMQQAQRAECNHALEYAIREANRLKLPVMTLFGITQSFPEANLRHYAFMLEGLVEVREALRRRGIRFVAKIQPPREAVLALAGDAALLVTDRGYLHIQKQWRASIAMRAPCKVIQVETDVVVPVETVSDKEEYAARTIRPKIHRHLDDFMKPLEPTRPVRDSLDLKAPKSELEDVDSLLERLRINREVGRVSWLRGGTSEAKRHFKEFVSEKFPDYADGRNEPAGDCMSHMSPYLHFGHISPLHIALVVREAHGVSKKSKDAYLEELIVRRELSVNFCHYNPAYDSLTALPEWAQRTLKKHAKDAQKYTYTPRELERAHTHDKYWNAAQREMVLTGKMHNYMRMYWGKKIIEWCRTPEEAFRIALYLNNKYELDGRDPNSYAGVAWCFGKHDQAWAERPIFGKVRYMNASGLDRKFDMAVYLRKVESLA